MEFLVIFLLTLLNGFFALSEIALVSVNVSRMQARADKGDRRARTVLKLLGDPEGFLSSVQVGITLIGIVAGAYGGANLTDDMEALLVGWPAIEAYARTIALVLVIGGITYFTIVVGELVPKTIALSNADGIALFAGPIIRVFALVTYPIVKLLSVSTSLLLKLMPVRTLTEERMSPEELRVILRTANLQGVLDTEESEAHQNIFRFSELRARNLMTHRSDVEWVDSAWSNAEIEAFLRSSLRSKFPVCRGKADDIEGTLHAREFLEQVDDPGPTLEKVIRQPIFVPESAEAFDILKLFKKNKQYIAFVVDEHGQFEGLVTLHDLTEAIVGDLPDEDETDIPQIVQRADGSWLADGALLIGELNQRIGRSIIDEEDTSYATVAGYILGKMEHLPKAGERMEDELFSAEVMDMDGNRIDKVLISIKEE